MHFNSKKPIIVLSDIHANLPSLEAVVKDINLGKDSYELIFLGDLFGYGPFPTQTYYQIKDLNPKIWLAGNHDKALEEKSPRYWNMNGFAKKCIDIHRKTTSVSIQLNLLERQSKIVDKGFVYSHGVPVDDDGASVETYDREYSPDGDKDKLLRLWEEYYPESHIWMIGHSHVQRFWWYSTKDQKWFIYPNHEVTAEGFQGLSINEVKENDIQKISFTLPSSRLEKDLVVINPGTVGFTREGAEKKDDTTTAQYASIIHNEDEVTFSFFTIPYNSARVREWWRLGNYPVEDLERIY